MGFLIDGDFFLADLFIVERDGDGSYFSGGVPLSANGFHSPPAPSLVVSVASLSAKIDTLASGNRLMRCNAEVRPQTPPPTTAMLDCFADAIVTREATRRRGISWPGVIADDLLISDVL